MAGEAGTSKSHNKRQRGVSPSWMTRKARLRDQQRALHTQSPTSRSGVSVLATFAYTKFYDIVNLCLKESYYESAKAFLSSGSWTRKDLDSLIIPRKSASNGFTGSPYSRLVSTELLHDKLKQANDEKFLGYFLVSFSSPDSAAASLLNVAGADPIKPDKNRNLSLIWAEDDATKLNAYLEKTRVSEGG